MFVSFGRCCGVDLPFRVPSDEWMDGAAGQTEFVLLVPKTDLLPPWHFQGSHRGSLFGVVYIVAWIVFPSFCVDSIASAFEVLMEKE